MKDKLLNIKKQALEEINLSNDLKELDKIRVTYLGKKGELTLVLREMGKLSKEERPVMGALANEVREAIEKKLEM